MDGPLSVIQDERDLQLDAVFRDAAVLSNFHLLVGNPGRFDVPERLRGARNAFPDGIVEAFLGRGLDLGHRGNTHGGLLSG
jgi:hypothetical protein